MTTHKPPSNRFQQVRAEQLEYNAKREQGYRERALKIYPWICGRCAREFDRRNLSDITVKTECYIDRRIRTLIRSDMEFECMADTDALNPRLELWRAGSHSQEFDRSGHECN